MEDASIPEDSGTTEALCQRTSRKRSRGESASESGSSSSLPPLPMEASSSRETHSPQKPMLDRMLELTSIALPDAQEIRLEDDPEALQELSESMRDEGQINPITVRETPEGFALVAGRRRLKAAAALGWPSIRATVLADDGTRRSGITLIENMQRRELSPIEEANALGDLFEQLGHDLSSVARKVSRSKVFVAERLELLSFTPELMQAVHDRQISIGAAKWLAKIADRQTRDEYIQQAIANNITADMARSWHAQAAQGAPKLAAERESGSDPAVVQPVYVMTTPCGLCQEHVEVPKALRLHLCPECAQSLRASINAGR